MKTRLMLLILAVALCAAPACCQTPTTRPAPHLSPSPVVAGPNNPNGPTVNLSEFLAPGRSHYEAFRQAVAACRDRHAARLLLPTATYHFDDPAILARPGTPHLVLDGLSDLVIDGQGSALLFHHIRPGIQLKNCQRVCLQNLIIDWDITLASPATAALDPAGQLVLRVDPAWPVTNDMLVRSVATFDLPNRRWMLNTHELYHPKDVRLIAPQTYYSPDFAKTFTPGMTVIIRHYLYEAHAIAFTDPHTSDLTFDHITIYQCPGMGFCGTGGDRGYRLTHCVIARKDDPHRLISATADGFHVGQSHGDIILEDCDFSSQGDDAVNIHGLWACVGTIDGPRAITLTGRASNIVLALLETGTPLSFHAAANLAPLGEAQVTAIQRHWPADSATLTLDRDLPPSVKPGDFVADLSRTSPYFLIRNNYFHDNRARGMLIQASHGLIENNRIERTQLAALQLTTDCKFWHEGVGVADLVLRNNTFKTSNYTPWERGPNGRHMAAVNLIVDTPTGLGDFALHSHITFDHNTIQDTPGLGLLIASAHDVTIRDTRLLNCNTEPWIDTGKTIHALAQGALMITRSNHITVQGTHIETTGPQYDHGIYVDPTTTSDVTLTESDSAKRELINDPFSPGLGAGGRATHAPSTAP